MLSRASSLKKQATVAWKVKLLLSPCALTNHNHYAAIWVLLTAWMPPKYPRHAAWMAGITNRRKWEGAIQQAFLPNAEASIRLIAPFIHLHGSHGVVFPSFSLCDSDNLTLSLCHYSKLGLINNDTISLRVILPLFPSYSSSLLISFLTSLPLYPLLVGKLGSKSRFAFQKYDVCQTRI